MNPYELNEIVKRLRNGEEVTCPICHKGKMEGVGDYKTTKCFKCNDCGKRLNMD